MPTSSRSRTAPPIAVLLIILAIGAGFRFLNLGLVRHGYDDSYPAYDALRMLDAQAILLIGQPSSVFLDNPPLMSYLQAIPLLIWRSPWAVYIPIVALNTVAIWFVYRAAQGILGDTIGLLSAFLFAVNPWIVFFSRATWVQALIPLFTALVAWGLWPTITVARRSQSRTFVAGLAVTAMTQTYIQAWGVLAQIAPLIALFRRRIPRRALFLALITFAIATMAYGVGLSKSWDTNRVKLVRLFSSRSELRLTKEGLDHAARLVTGRDFENVWAREETAEYHLRQRLAQAVDFLVGAALIAGIARAAIGLRERGRKRRASIVLLIWFAVPILLMSLSAEPVHIHYLMLSCPAGHVLAAWGISPLLRRAGLRWITMPVLLAIAIVFGFNLHCANKIVANGPVNLDFSDWPLAAGARLGSAVRELSQFQEGGYPRRIHAEGHEALLSSLSGTYVTTLRGLHFPDYVVLPDEEPLLYVLINAGPEPQALGPLQESFPERDILLADGTRVSFLRAPPYSRDAALALPDVAVDWPSEAGLSVLGYSLNTAIQPGQSILATTYWRVEELHPQRAEWYVGAFYHLLSQTGNMIVNVDGHGQWAYRWQLGDVYVERMSIPVPPDLAPSEYQLEIGLFDCIHTCNYLLHSPEGPAYAITIPITVEGAD